MKHHKGSNDGEELLRNVALRMNKMTGKGEDGVSQLRMPIGGSSNPNSDSEYEGPRIFESHKQIQEDTPIGGAMGLQNPNSVPSTNDSGSLKDIPRSNTTKNRILVHLKSHHTRKMKN
ncbi:hypothetical protein Tco_1099011 [Tanacetum coccineum]